jgi:hypothetical protein
VGSGLPPNLCDSHRRPVAVRHRDPKSIEVKDFRTSVKIAMLEAGAA